MQNLTRKEVIDKLNLAQKSTRILIVRPIGYGMQSGKRVNLFPLFKVLRDKKRFVIQKSSSAKAKEFLDLDDAIEEFNKF